MTAKTATDQQIDPCHRNWVWRTIQFILSRVFIVWLRYRVRGVERLPQGGALFLVNHTSSLDPLLVAVRMKRPVSYLARHELFSRPGIGWVLKNTYVMPIKRASAGTESIRLSVERLEQGYYVGVFPEGTRSDDGLLHEIKPGFIAILRRAKVPVVPVGIAGAREAYPRGSVFLKPGRVCVVLGEPISADVVEPLAAKGRESELLELVRERMEACLTEARTWRDGHAPPV